MKKRGKNRKLWFRSLFLTNMWQRVVRVVLSIILNVMQVKK